MGYPLTALKSEEESNAMSRLVATDDHQRQALEERRQQAQKMETLGRLSSGVAHDFNNIVTIMAGYSEMLLCRLGRDDPAYEAAEEIKKASDRAAALTRQLLAFSRKQVVEMQVLHLNAIVLHMEKMLRRLTREDIELSIELDPALGYVRIDAGQIEQVIMNLVVNARDAMPAGGMLTIETTHVAIGQSGMQRHHSLRSTPYVRLAVSDTGCGIDAETHVHLFEPFFTTKEPGQGTGLGLSMVHDIIKKSGGTIWVNSKAGYGTTFEIYLPEVEKPSAAEQASNSFEESLQGTETILLVEDEEAVRVLIRSILQRCGYTVLEATHGKEALLTSARHTEPIHLLLTDVVMPRMSGQDLARRLTPLRPNTKVLYMSGYADSAPLLQDVVDDDIAFIGKPFTPDAMARQVRHVLDAPQRSL